MQYMWGSASSTIRGMTPMTPSEAELGLTGDMYDDYTHILANLCPKQAVGRDQLLGSLLVWQRDKFKLCQDITRETGPPSATAVVGACGVGCDQKPGISRRALPAQTALLNHISDSIGQANAVNRASGLLGFEKPGRVRGTGATYLALTLLGPPPRAALQQKRSAKFQTRTFSDSYDMGFMDRSTHHRVGIPEYAKLLSTG